MDWWSSRASSRATGSAVGILRGTGAVIRNNLFVGNVTGVRIHDENFSGASNTRVRGNVFERNTVGVRLDARADAVNNVIERERRQELGVLRHPRHVPGHHLRPVPHWWRSRDGHPEQHRGPERQCSDDGQWLPGRGHPHVHDDGGRRDHRAGPGRDRGDDGRRRATWRRAARGTASRRRTSPTAGATLPGTTVPAPASESSAADRSRRSGSTLRTCSAGHAARRIRRASATADSARPHSGRQLPHATYARSCRSSSAT